MMKSDRVIIPYQKSWFERFRKEIRNNWALYLLVSIPVAYLIIFKYIPMYGVQLAFRSYSPARSISGSQWLGFKHFQTFMTDFNFKQIMRNTILISLYSLCTFPLPIVLALMLNYTRLSGFKKTVQLVSYAPHFISTVVMVGLILQFFDQRSGILNMLINALGGESVYFMAKAEYFRPIYVWSGVWQGVGYSSIIYIAALSGISPELHEAAIVDGANILKRIWHVDLPGIAPTISILLIMSCGSILSVGYEKIYLLQNSLNLDVSEVISTYVYKPGIASSTPQYSYDTAIGLFVSLVNVFMLLIVNKVSDRLSGSSLF